MQKRPTLTEKQRAVLNYIARMVQITGYPPTLRQIGKEFGIRSTNGVRGHLKALQKKGFINRSTYTSRGIELLGYGFKKALTKEVSEIPVVGRIAAGAPILAVENIEDTLLLDKELIRGERLFALRVKGDSMTEAGILDGDFVVVRPQGTAQNGEIVVALLDDEATVKTFYRDAFGKVRLQPANAHYKPIITTTAKIAGKVVGLLRTKL